MDEIVKKVAEAAPASAAPTGQPGSLDREIRLRVRAQTMGRQKKQAEVWSEVSGQPAGSRWAIQCDEGARVGGDDTAPPPLAYFSAGLAFWLLTQISRSGELMKLELKQVHVDQVTRFFRKGSILGGTIQSGSLGIEVRVDVESDEPRDKIARLVRVTQESCFTHGAIANPVPVETDVRLNGQPLEVRWCSTGRLRARRRCSSSVGTAWFWKVRSARGPGQSRLDARCSRRSSGSEREGSRREILEERRLVHWRALRHSPHWIGKERRMTRAGVRILDNGEQFPDLSMDTVKHGRLTFPEAFGDGWGVFLIYRAHW